MITAHIIANVPRRTSFDSRRITSYVQSAACVQPKKDEATTLPRVSLLLVIINNNHNITIKINR